MTGPSLTQSARTLEKLWKLDSKRKMARPGSNSLLTSIVAVGLDGAIGVNNKLPWKLKSDLSFFKSTTVGNIVIMGRKTFESIGRCLPKRENIILSRRCQLFEPHPGCHHAHSVAETLEMCKRWPAKEAFVIGGAQTYLQFAPFVDRYLITIVESRFPEADAFFSTDILEDYEAWERNEIRFEKVEEPDADQFDFSIIELRHPNPVLVQERHKEVIDELKKRNHLLERKNRKSLTERDLKLDGRWSFA